MFIKIFLFNSKTTIFKGSQHQIGPLLKIVFNIYSLRGSIEIGCNNALPISGGRDLIQNRAKNQERQSFTISDFRQNNGLKHQQPQLCTTICTLSLFKTPKSLKSPFPPYHPLTPSFTFTIPIRSTMFHQKVKSKQLPHYFQKSYSSCSVSASVIKLFSFLLTILLTKMCSSLSQHMKVRTECTEKLLVL